MSSTQDESRSRARARPTFLLVSGFGITALFVWIISGFVLALVVAAIAAALAQPLYRRLVRLFGGRRTIASAATVVLSLILVIVPLVLFLGVLVGEAIGVSEAAGEWVAAQAEQSESWQEQLAEDPYLSRLLPYQDEILAKAGELTARAGSFVAQGFAAGARGTAEFLLMLFVMLYAMFTFLVGGRAIVEKALRLTPLSADDKDRLIRTFVSVGRATIKGTLIIGVVQGGLAGLSFWVAGIGGAVFWGTVMTVLSIIPGVGTALVWVPAVIFLALDGQVGAAVGVGLWCALVVGTVDNLLRPLLIGKDTEMPDLLVMLTTLGGLALFGAVGMVVGPIVGALYVTIWRMWGSATNPGLDAVPEEVGTSIPKG